MWLSVHRIEEKTQILRNSNFDFMLPRKNGTLVNKLHSFFIWYDFKKKSQNLSYSDWLSQIWYQTEWLIRWLDSISNRFKSNL